MHQTPIRRVALAIIVLFLVVGALLLGYSNFHSTELTAYNALVSKIIQVNDTLDDLNHLQLKRALGKLSDPNAIEADTDQLLRLKEDLLASQSLIMAAAGEQQVSAWAEQIDAFIQDMRSGYADVDSAAFEDRIENQKEAITQIKIAIISEIREINRYESRVMGTLTAVLVLLVIFLAVYMHVKVLRPLKKITDHFREGNLNGHGFQERIELKEQTEIGLLVSEYNQLVDRAAVMQELNEQIYAMHDLDEILTFIFDNFQRFFNYNRIGLAIVNVTEDSVIAQSAISDGDVILGKNYSEKLSATSLQLLLERNEIRIIDDLEQYLEDHPFSASTARIVQEGMKSSLTIPLLVKGKAVGVIFFSSRSRNAFHDRHISMLKSVVKSMAVAFENSVLHADMILGTIRGFASIVEAKDNVTGDHIDRLSEYSRFIAQMLMEEDVYTHEIDTRFLEEIEKFAPLHDIGKVNIPDRILNKPGRLTDEEFEVMKTHTDIGYEIMTSMAKQQSLVTEDHFEMARDIIRYHHEKVDGSGYPQGILGDEIPLSARIVAVADVFDALVSERPYKKGMSFDEAFSILENSSDTHFDSLIIDVLSRRKDDFRARYLKRVSGVDLARLEVVKKA